MQRHRTIRESLLRFQFSIVVLQLILRTIGRCIARSFLATISNRSEINQGLQPVTILEMLQSPAGLANQFV